MGYRSDVKILCEPKAYQIIKDNMEKYNIVITETLRKVVRVEAEKSTSINQTILIGGI